MDAQGSSTVRSCPCNIHIKDQESVSRLQPYLYAPLPVERSIRLFHLTPGLPDNPLRGHISTVHLERGGLQYVALSWTWGTTESLHAIECDGKRLQINCDLYSALYRLRCKHDGQHSDAYFIDALSINQERDQAALQERASQVRLMRDIFGSASRVLINLGEGLEDQEGVLLLIEKLCNVSHQQWDAITKSPEKLDRLQLPPLNSPVWKSLISLYQRPWFERIWVVQEYALAKEADFFFGDEIVPDFAIRHSLVRAFFMSRLVFPPKSQFYEDDHHKAVIGNGLRRPFNLMEQMQQCCDRYRLESLDQHRSLDQVLAMTSVFKATDERDRVYAIMGLIKSTDMSEFAIDYTETIEDCSKRLSIFLLQQGTIQCLFYDLACLSAGNHPSWMMKLEDHRAPNGVDRYVDQARHYGLWNAGGSTPISYRLSENRQDLTLRGTIVDQVVERSPEYPRLEEDAGEDLTDRWLREILGWDSLVRDSVFSRLSRESETPKQHKQLLQACRITVTAGGQLFGNGSDEVRRLSANDIQDFEDYSLPLKRNVLPWRKRACVRSVMKITEMMNTFCEGKCVGVTRKGALCLMPHSGEEGDELVVLRGFPTPFLVGRKGSGYQLLGGVYLYGMMNGEALAVLDSHESDISFC